MMALHSTCNAQDVLRIARSFIGVPYKHQGRSKQFGVDCLGLLILVYQEIYHDTPWRKVPNYSSHWSGFTRTSKELPFERREPLLHAAKTWLNELPDGARGLLPGDVALFRVKRGGPVHHCGIVDEGGKVIHAYDGHHVLSSAPTKIWMSPNHCYAFTWPGVKRWLQ